MMKPITSFTGDYRFLSNFYPSRIEYTYFESYGDGGISLVFPTVEHAYQASKTLITDLRMKISKISAPGAAKKFGNQIELRDDWNEVKVTVMRRLLELKFVKGTSLRTMLDLTKGRELIEGNSWGDTFWGECPLGTGNNMLGKILMEIRDGLC